MNINVKAAANVTQIMAKKMVETGKCGSIVNLSSICSKKALDGLMSYSLTIGAVDQMTRSMAI